MTLLCGWLSSDADEDAAPVIRGMAAALRSHAGQAAGRWSAPHLSLALLEAPSADPVDVAYAPAVNPDGRFHLWMAGEAFAGGNLIDVPDVDSTRTVDFRRRLLTRLLERGFDSIRELDGEYQIVVWDSAEKTLTILNDRYGGLPLYWARSERGFAFAGGVRGVLMAPGVAGDPDREAIREAVTFGGFRLGDRTNIAAVKMVPGASVVTVHGNQPAFRRYWRWSDIPPVPEQPIELLVEQAHHLWQSAIRRRISGAKRPGQTLSGGLDSRAILAEAAGRTPQWTAITYGVAGCDDARYASRAAEAVGATWVFHPLYSGRNPDWLELRTGYIQQTDGLIDLVDLMHLETLLLQAGLLDVHLSGYIGDAVSGPTFNEVTNAAEVVLKMPFYGARLSLSYEEALGRVEPLVAALDGASARFALFDHKLPQTTNRWTASWRPWLRVRKPFVDYAFFDFCQGLPGRVRGEMRLHERWLKSKYPDCFATIPNQKTGLPVLSPDWRVRIERARRFSWRKAHPLLAKLGMPARPRIRYYTADDVYWRVPEARERIENTILRPNSICCDLFGREQVRSVLNDWFERSAAPTQVLAALYVYESYHRDLAGHLSAQ